MAHDRVRPHRGLVVLVAILTFAQSIAVTPAPTRAALKAPETHEISAPAAPTPVVPYGSGGWKYQQTSQGGLVGFEAVGFNDAGWPTGSAPFGSTGGCPVAAGVATTWAVNTDLLLRRPMSIPAGTQGVEVWVVVDNDAIGVYWNSTLIGGPLVHEGCADANQPMRFAVNAASVTGSDVLAIRLRDRGSESYGNVQIVTGAMPNEPATCDVQCLENGGHLGDPVQSFSGAFTYSAVDLAIPGRGPAPSFARSYSSRDDRTGPMGPAWMHNYSARLRHPGDGSPDLLFVGPDGNTDRFTRNNDETFSPPPAVDRTLVRNADGTFVVTEPSQTRWTFDASGSLTAITDRFGNTSTLGYSAAGELISIADPAGRGALTLAYTAGKLTSVTDWASPARTVAYQYDAAGRLWKVTDREGKITTLGYDGTSSRLATITDARGNVALTLTYGADGKVATQKDAQGLLTGATTVFAYVVNPDGTRVTTVTAPPTSFEPTFSPTMVDTYNAQGFLTSRVARPSSTETLTESYAYDATGFRASVTDPRGATTEFCYDRTHAGATIAGSRGNLTRVIGPAPTAGANRPVTLIAYDVKRNVTQTVAPAGVPSGTTVTCSTNLSAFDAEFATDLAYDATGAKLLSTTSRFTDPDTGATTAVTKYEYGDAANPGYVTRIIPPRGNTTASPDYTYASTFTYFGTGTRAGMAESATDALGNTTTYDYDLVGRLANSVDPLGNAVGGVPAEHRTEVTYDQEDRVRLVKLPAPVAGGAQLISENRYDEVGNPIVRIDANGQVTTNAYDERDALLQVKESPNAWADPAVPPSGVITTEYAYDAGGNLVRMTRAKSDATYERATDYAYDGRGLVRRETQYPSWPTATPTLVATSTYDPNGNLAVATDQLGRTTTMAYDLLNRPTSPDFSDPATPDVAYGYDANGNRTAMTDGTGASSYVYDELDRLLSVTTPGPKTVGYRYDRDGNRTKLIYPDATAVTYTFDKASRLSGLVDWASRTVGYTYFADGALKDTTNPNGTVAAYAYDNARRLVDISHKLGANVFDRRAYALDPVGNVTGVSGGTAGETTELVSISTTRAKGNGASLDSYLSADGRYVVYHSDATNLDPADTNNVRDVFVRDRLTGTTSLVSASAAGVVGNGISQDPAISKDGRFVTFRSQANNLVTGDTNGTAWDIFVKDLQTGAVDRVSVSTAGAQANGASQNPLISADGRYVAYRSSATNLVTGDTNGQPDVFVRDRQSATTSRVSVATGGAQASGGVSDEPAISDDGRYVAFQSAATNLVASDTNALTDVFLHDRTTTTTTRLSVSSAGVQATGASTDATINGDGSRVGFVSSATNLVASDTNAKEDIFVRLIATSTTVRASLSNTGAQVSSSSSDPSISTDGVKVAFYSTASTLVTGDTNSRGDVFVRDLTASTTVRKSLTAGGAQVNEASSAPWLAGDGTAIGFASVGTNLVPEDTDATSDIYVRAAGLETSTYAYDRLYRLTSATEPTVGTTSYTYDPIGNRLTRVRDSSTTYTYDRADRISAAGATAITVNAVGATTARGADTFAYDQANRLTSATVAGVTETSTYDGDGVRFSRQVGAGPLIRSVTDPAAGLPVTIDDGTRKYVWGLGLAYAVSGTALEVYHTDRLGSVRAITDATGVETATYRTDEFGIPTVTTGTSTQPFTFTGEPHDATGLTYLRARYYDPSLGRFLTRDTWPGSVGAPQTLDRYAYVGNNPATFTDPSGHCLQFLLASLIGGGTVVVGAVVSSACAAIGAVALAIAGGAAVGYVAYELQPRTVSEVRDQRLGESIPPIRDDWARRVQEYRPEPPSWEPGKGPIGPRGPGRNIRWKIVLGTLVVAKVAKSLVLRPR